MMAAPVRVVYSTLSVGSVVRIWVGQWFSNHSMFHILVVFKLVNGVWVCSVRVHWLIASSSGADRFDGSGATRACHFVRWRLCLGSDGLIQRFIVLCQKEGGPVCDKLQSDQMFAVFCLYVNSQSA